MANIETYTNYANASRRLGNKDRVSIGYATELVRSSDGKTIALAHHGSGIVYMSDNDDYQVTMSGWDSTTTRERINQYVRARFSGNVSLSRINGRTALSVLCGEWNGPRHSLEIESTGTYAIYREEWDGYEVVRITCWDSRGRRVYRMRVR